MGVKFLVCFGLFEDFLRQKKVTNSLKINYVNF